MRPSLVTDLSERSTEERPPVVFVVHQTGLRANGGVESLTQILKHLRRVRPVIATQLETPTTKAWRSAGLEVHCLPSSDGSDRTGKIARVTNLARSNAHIASLIRACGARVVHCNDISAFMHAGAGARLAGARLLFNIRDTKVLSQRYGPQWLVAAHLCNTFVALSKEMAEQLTTRVLDRTLPFRRATMEYVYSIVDFDKMRPASDSEREQLRQKLGIDPSLPTLVYVAAFVAKKAQLAFIENTLPRLARSNRHLRVYFVGDYDPQRNEYALRCRNAVDRLGLTDCVRFAGFQPNIADWYRAADLSVIASKREGMARAMIESIACGTPMVSFEVCSATEILDAHECGVVVGQGDYAGLAQAVTALLAEPERRQLMATNGPSIARTLFDPSRAASRYETLYAQLLPASRT